MSEHANKPEQSKPGKRLEQTADKAAPPLTPEEAKAERELRIMIVMIVAATIMVITTMGVLLYSRWFKKPNLPPGPTQLSDDTSESAAPRESGGEEPDIDAIQPKVSGDRRSKDIYTILVFGADLTSGLTDSMMLVTYDVTNQQAAVMSLPRDTLINVSRSNKCLNAVYNSYSDSEQGLEALKSEVSELVGYIPDYYVRIDWEIVGEMVDAIGGVWFDNPYDMRYDDPYQDLFINQPSGYRKLTGADAMEVVRWRHNGTDPNTGRAYPGGGDGSDLSRLAVQHSLLKAVLQQTLQIQNVVRISQLADLFGRRVESDLTVENLLWFGKSAILGGLKVDDVEFFTMPNCSGGPEGSRYYGRVYPDEAELLKVINEKLNPYVEKVTIKELDLIRVSADGNTLSSSTGVLADPSAGYSLPASAGSSPDPRPEPSASAAPSSSRPPESSPPRASAPVATHPPASSAPMETDPPATEPPSAGTQAPEVPEPPTEGDNGTGGEDEDLIT